ncbi:MAG: histidinol phosphatase [Sandaracinaceae bacterium]|nr:histidinol phosphatase [Sandaracinaceae bacterium]
MDAFDLDRIGGHAALLALTDELLACGELALTLYSGGAAARTQRKPDRSPVTEADQLVEERLLRFLRKRYPDASVWGEETGAAEGTNGLRFLVDPIDGTRAFVRGLPTWSVLLGLEADGEPVLGMALMPASGDLFVGAKGHGATMNGRPLRVSQVASLDDAVVSHGGLDQFRAAQRLDLPATLGERVYTCRGFADFDGYRQLLLGRVDAMVDLDIKPYDVCPAAVLVREAGGRFTSFAGHDSIHEPNTVASNGRVHDELLSLVRRAP